MLKPTIVQLFKRILDDDLYYVLALIYLLTVSYSVGLIIGLVWIALL